jgi:hypothetical protein
VHLSIKRQGHASLHRVGGQKAVRTLRRRKAEQKRRRANAECTLTRRNSISPMARNCFGDDDGRSPGPIKATRNHWLGFDSSFTLPPPPLPRSAPSPLPAAQAPQSATARPSVLTARSRCSNLSIICIPVDGLDLLHLHPLVDGEVPPSPAAAAAHRRQGPPSPASPHRQRATSIPSIPPAAAH